jgi:methionine-rich copper-binding protein CopC
MRYPADIFRVALLMGCAVAQAHTHLQKSTPPDGSVVTKSPPTLTLQFSEAARLTAAWIQKDNEPRRKLAALPEKAATEVTVTMPTLMPGGYLVSWRAVSSDGHVVPGQIHFTVASPGAPAPPAGR